MGEPDQILFCRAVYYTEYQKKVAGKLDPPGKGQYHTTKTKTVTGTKFDKFVECDENALVNYRTLRFFASRAWHAWRANGPDWPSGQSIVDERIATFDAHS